MEINQNIPTKKRQTAGVLIVCRQTGRVFLAKRAQGEQAGTWACISGELKLKGHLFKLEPGELPRYDTSILDGLKREMGEEIGIAAASQVYKFIQGGTEVTNKFKEQNGNKFKIQTQFSYYIGICKNEFVPELNDEHSDAGWFSIDKLPHPLYPKMDKKIFDLVPEKGKIKELFRKKLEELYA